MRRIHVRAPKARPKRLQWKEIAVGGILLAFIAVFTLTRLYRTTAGAYFTSNEIVEEIRIIEIPMPEAENGGLKIYRIEARVSYSLNGTREDRWLPASEPTTTRDLLEARLKTPPKTCVVYWPPKHPEKARCRLK
jgi:hypothetical protein